VRTVFYSLLGLSFLILLSCENDDPSRPPIEYRLTVGDTTIIIPDAAIQFAGARGSLGNFVWDAYMLREYQVARDPNLPHPGSPFTGSLTEWKALGWPTRQTFLIAPYTAHDANTDDGAQFFYEIGTYLEQFGYGWRDTYDPDADLSNPAVHIWLHPADTTLVRDNTSTPEFDGTSHLIEQYRALWIFQ
jgi:hypothetical protein